MKLKLKLDQKTILDFLLQNVEKIGLALFAAVFLLMLYSALKAVGHFDKTPELLQQTVTAGKAEIDKTPAETGLVVSDYVSQAKRSRVHIEEKPYSHLAAWVNPLFEPRLLRNAPPVFAVQQLQATTSAGAFRTTGGAAGGEGVSGRRWVVVTGLVPIEKQEAAYAETFKPSVLYEPQNDVPVYLGYWVERAEVSSAGDAANPNWEKAKTFISKEAIDTALKEWGVTSSGANDVVGMEYLDEALTFPLGPLVNRNWDKAVAHPEIPVKKLTEAAGGMGDMPPGAKPAGSTREAAADTPFGDSKSTGEMERAMPGEMAGPDQEKKVAQYKLFRFFDFSVEPNKQYVYRVCLALKNPNRDRKQGLLAQPDLATAKFLKTKWSDPSAAISVPGDTRVLAGAITPARGEPWCKIVVVKWLSANGIEAFVEKVKIVRGQVADFPGETFKPPALVHQNVAADFAPPEMM